MLNVVENKKIQGAKFVRDRIWWPARRCSCRRREEKRWSGNKGFIDMRKFFDRFNNDFLARRSQTCFDCLFGRFWSHYYYACQLIKNSQGHHSLTWAAHSRQAHHLNANTTQTNQPTTFSFCQRNWSLEFKLKKLLNLKFYYFIFILTASSSNHFDHRAFTVYKLQPQFMNLYNNQTNTETNKISTVINIYATNPTTTINHYFLTDSHNYNTATSSTKGLIIFRKK